MISFMHPPIPDGLVAISGTPRSTIYHLAYEPENGDGEGFYKRLCGGEPRNEQVCALKDPYLLGEPIKFSGSQKALRLCKKCAGKLPIPLFFVSDVARCGGYDFVIGIAKQGDTFTLETGRARHYDIALDKIISAWRRRLLKRFYRDVKVANEYQRGQEQAVDGLSEAYRHHMEKFLEDEKDTPVICMALGLLEGWTRVTDPAFELPSEELDSQLEFLYLASVGFIEIYRKWLVGRKTAS